MANIRTLKDIKGSDPGGGRGPPGGGPPGGGAGRGVAQVTDPKNVKLVHSEAEFNNHMRNATGLVVVDWSASWCGPCKMIYPYLVELSVQYRDVLFLKLDVDELRALADRNNITAMPTFQFFRSLEMIHEIRGANPSILQEKVKELRAGGGGAQASASPSSGSGHSWGSGYSLSGNGPPAAAADASGQQQFGGEGGAALDVFVGSLTDMGFPVEKAKAAVIATKSASLDAAIEWILAHQDDIDMTEADPASAAESSEAGTAMEVDTPASKPAETPPVQELTEEEKRVKAEEMKAKLEAIREKKRKEAEARDLEIEKSRIKNAENAMRSKRTYEEEKQRIEAAKEKARKLKEKKYKAEVRARVKAAKEARLRENARRRGEVVDTAPIAAGAAARAEAAPVQAKPAPAKVHSECAVAVRTRGNGTLEKVFHPSDTMQAVHDWVLGELGHSNFTLQTMYPRKKYGPSDMGTTLKAAGLVPRGALTLA